MSGPNIHEIDVLHNRKGVFKNREHAGSALASMLGKYRSSDAIVLGIPAVGVPVAAEVAHELALPFDVAITKKITPPWNSEFGYGAVAFDGTVLLNEELLPQLGLDKQEITEGIQKAKTKTEKRNKRYRGDRPFPEIGGRTVILIDDGLATGITFKVTITALHQAGAERIIGAVPTGHSQTVNLIAKKVDELYCANIRGGIQYAVADAYEHWHDLSDDEVMTILYEFKQQEPEKAVPSLF